MPEFETLVIHAGQPPDPTTGAIMTPIYQTSTYRQEGVGRHRGYEYSRTGNPTRTALERCLAALEDGTNGLAFASGMAAIDAIAHLLQPGDHVLAVDDLYGGTYRLFESVYAKLGISFSYASPANPAEFVSQARAETRLIWLETPTNPLLRLCDIAEIARLAKRSRPGVLVAVDNTFATPYLQRPLQLGADLVHHSTTKYLSGHSDVVGGAVICRDEQTAGRLRVLQNSIGAVPGPFDCFLVLRGIKTLGVRMDRHCSSAQLVAEHLKRMKGVAAVYYPGLAEPPQAELASRQMRKPGGMVSFVLRAGAAAAVRFVEATQLFSLAESLGSVESLIEVPAAMTHASTAGTPLAIDPALIRLSVGLEAVGDLIADLDHALDSSS
ncbi:MAG TPA: cystathionine gamma-synthase [Anaerolineales bacterium]|nr:cystathionine gamma-synthase [Anaerolineales bacterium]